MQHPALGGCFGPGCLVAYGANLAGDDSEPPDCDGHGTHVAGTIAAQKNEYVFTGAAPDVILGSYRILGCNDNTIRVDVLIAAVNQAYEDGSDIITASIGGTSGFSDEPTALAFHRIVNAGVPCTVAASNAGAAGILFPSDPSSGEGVAAIASTENYEISMLLLEGSYSTGNGSATTFGWVAGSPDTWGNISLPLWSNPYNTSDPSDSCKSLPADTPDLSGYVVMIPADGECFLFEKFEDAAAHGARFIMVYADWPTIPTFGTDQAMEGMGSVTFEQGLEWQHLLSRNVNITINIVDPNVAPTFITSEQNPRGGFISSYSSWGPTYDLHLKPQFSTPGSYILSTYPMDKGGYAILSGTSMATPLAAAIYALVGQVQGTFDPATIESLLSATAKPNLFHNRESVQPFLAPTPQQGGGLIQAYDAAYSNTLVNVSSFSFNDTDHLLANAEFTIKNLGTTSKTYTLSNIGAATVYATSGDNPKFPIWGPNEMTTEGASLSFSSDKVTIPAGGEAIVTITPTPPALNTSRLPIYSGYVAINTTDGDSFSLPYVGVVGSLYDLDPLNREPYSGTGVQDFFGNDMVANQSFTIPKGVVEGGYARPVPYAALAWQSPLVRVDVMPLDPAANTTEVVGVEILGSVEGFPVPWQSRGSVSFSVFTGKLSDGSIVPEGGYKFLFRALRNFGDANKEEDYDTMESLPFYLTYLSLNL